MIGFGKDAAPPPHKVAARHRPYSGISSTDSGLLSYFRGVDHQKILTLGLAQIQERVVGVRLEIQRIALVQRDALITDRRAHAAAQNVNVFLDATAMSNEVPGFGIRRKRIENPVDTASRQHR